MGNRAKVSDERIQSASGNIVAFGVVGGLGNREWQMPKVDSPNLGGEEDLAQLMGLLLNASMNAVLQE